MLQQLQGQPQQEEGELGEAAVSDPGQAQPTAPASGGQGAVGNEAGLTNATKLG